VRYEGMIYRPPSESNSLLIQSTIGCPHNRCTFCAMYKDIQFRIRPVKEIKEDLTAAKKAYGDRVKTIFLPDGNSIIMKTEELVDIFSYAYEVFPQLTRITLYGSARFINIKSEKELVRLKNAGLGRIHSGMETGNDYLLTKIQKGATAQEIIAAGQKILNAGIELSEYVLIGIGGREHSTAHALSSAAVLNAIHPHFIRLRTYIPMPGTQLFTEYKQGAFHLLQPHEALTETKLFISNLTANSFLASDHYSNYAYVNGQIPRDKPVMLDMIDKLLSIPEDHFRPPAIGNL